MEELGGWSFLKGTLFGVGLKGNQKDTHPGLLSLFWAWTIFVVHKKLGLLLAGRK